MATITLFGLDIGKHSFHLVGQDANGKPVFKRQFTRSSVTTIKVELVEPGRVTSR